MSDKPKEVDFTRNNIAGEVEKIRRNLPHTEEYVRLMAKLHKAKFDALVKEGFTEAQALELCKTLLGR